MAHAMAQKNSFFSINVMQKMLKIIGIMGITAFLLTSCGETPPEEDTVPAETTTTTTEDATEPTPEEPSLSIVGEWNMIMTQDDQPGKTITAKGVFNPDGTAYTNYGAHYTITEKNITVQADNGSSTMQGIITDAGHMNGTWINNLSGKTGTWTAVR